MILIWVHSLAPVWFVSHKNSKSSTWDIFVLSFSVSLCCPRRGCRQTRSSRRWKHSQCGVRDSVSTLKMNYRSRKAASLPLLIPHPICIWIIYWIDLWITTFLFLYCLRCKVINIFMSFFLSLSPFIVCVVLPHTSTWVYFCFLLSFPKATDFSWEKYLFHIISASRRFWRVSRMICLCNLAELWRSKEKKRRSAFLCSCFGQCVQVYLKKTTTLYKYFKKNSFIGQ